MKKLFGSSVFVLILFFSGSAYSDSIGNTSHTKGRMHALSYGDRSNQIGFTSGLDLENRGPESFWATDTGEIYILDSVKSRVILLDSNGSIVREFSIGIIGNDIAVDDDTVYVFEGRSKKVYLFSKSGLAKGVMLPGADFGTPDYFKFTRGRLVMVNTDQNEYLLSEKKMLFGREHSDGRVFKTLRTESGLGEINIFAEASRKNNSNFINKTITVPMTNVLSISLIGEDRRGNIYVQVETKSESKIGVNLNVCTYNKKGILKSVIRDIPNDYRSWTAKLLQVTGNGDIYQLIPADNGVKINVWDNHAKGDN